MSLWPCSSRVYLEIDNRECAQSSEDCFSLMEQAASFIAAEHLRAELPYPLFSVTSELFSSEVFNAGSAEVLVD